jgi:Trk-type K+ transport system membrane component
MYIPTTVAFHRSVLSHPHATYRLRCIRLKKATSQFTFTLKLAAAVFAETLSNLQRSTRPNPENRYRTYKIFSTWFVIVSFILAFFVSHLSDLQCFPGFQ